MFYKKSAFILVFSVFFSLTAAFASQSVSLEIPVGVSYVPSDMSIDSYPCSVLEWHSGLKADYFFSIGEDYPSYFSIGLFAEGDVTGLLSYGEVASFEYRAKREWGMELQSGLALGFFDEAFVFYPFIYSRRSYENGKITYSGMGGENTFSDSSHIIINSFKTGLQFNQEYFFEQLNFIWMDDASSSLAFKAGGEVVLGVRLGKRF